MAPRAVIDIGSHSVLLLVAKESPDGPRALLEEYRISALGAGLGKTGRIDPEAAERALSTIDDYLSRCRDLQASKVVLVGTSALREADNQERILQFLSRSGERTIRVLSQREEARLTRLGALSGLDAGEGAVVFDLGGRSTEMTWPGRGESIPLGCQRGTEGSLLRDPPQAAEIEHLRTRIQSVLGPLQKPPVRGTLVVSGGTATTLASMHLALSSYRPERVHGLEMPRERLAKLVDRLVSVPLAVRKTLAGIEPDRAGVLPAGAIVLDELCRWSRRNSFLISARGLTWGVWHERS